ncbi:MAG: carboxypeptidase regulatory-like domain-containing protein [Thermoplasmatota archaeon]
MSPMPNSKLLLLSLATLTALSPLGAMMTTAQSSSSFIVKGIVTDAATGAPIEGALVVGTSEGPTTNDVTRDSATTDSNGEYVLHLGAGDASIQASMDGYSSESRVESIDGPTVIGFTLAAEPGHAPVLQGTVHDATTGKPVEGATVKISRGTYAAGSATMRPCCCCPYPPPSASTLTDENGHYQLDANAGDITVEIVKDNYLTTIEHVTLKAGETRTLDVRLRPVPKEDAVLRGIVIDRATGDPISGAQVSVQNLETGKSAWNQTGTDGRFEMRLPPGLIDVHVYVYGYAPPPCVAYAEPAVASSDAPAPAPGNASAPASSGATPTTSPAPPTGIRCGPAVAVPNGNANGYYEWTNQFELASGSTDVTIGLIAKPGPDVTLQGYVVDADALKGIPNAWVSVRNLDTGEYGSAQTDADGSYKIPVRSGYLIVTAAAPGYFAREVIVIAHGPSTVRRDVILHAGETSYGCGWGGPCYAIDAPAPGAPAYAKDASGAPMSGAPMSGAPVSAAAASGASAPGVPAYTGTGGGLGPYDPNSAPQDDAVVQSAAVQSVPGFEAVIVVTALACVAVLVARRQN